MSGTMIDRNNRSILRMIISKNVKQNNAKKCLEQSYLNANFLQNFTCNVLIFEVHLVALFQHHISLTNKTFWSNNIWENVKWTNKD